MPVTKLTISLPEELATAIRREAEDQHTSVSAVVAQAAERQLRKTRMATVVAEWEAEHGPVTDEEMDRVRTWMQG